MDVKLKEKEHDTDENTEQSYWKELSKRLGKDSPLPFDDYITCDSD